MDKKTALQTITARAFAVRIPMSKLCDAANVSRATMARWKRNPEAVTVRTLSKLESELDRLEATHRQVVSQIDQNLAHIGRE